MTAIEDFNKYIGKRRVLSHACDLLYWDIKTLAPKKARESAADDMAYYSSEIFALDTSDELYGILQKLNEEDTFNSLPDYMQYVAKTMLEDYTRSKRIPPDFYAEHVKITNASAIAWEDAKRTNDYALFAPHLKAVIESTRKMLEYTDPGKDPYEALLDSFEKGMDSATIDKLFEELKDDLIPMIREINSRRRNVSPAFSEYFDPDAQKKVQDMLLSYIGFDFERGCVGESEHPFTMTLSYDDVRVTNHYYPNDVIDSMFSAIHEGGHAVFEQNVNPDYADTIAGGCRHMGIHESQSRFYENILGRNRNFWIPVYDKLGEILPHFKEIPLDDFYAAINDVKSSLIRTSADEVTYCLHIIIRYEIEKAIFKDNIDLDTLPALWNDKMEHYLGIRPSDDAHGILQDMHWSDGSFGYFPSYLLGSIYDGMFLEALESELGSVDDILKAGRIKDITAWLNRNIHQYGSTRTPKEVIEAVCHRPLSAKPLLNYFHKKYDR